MYITILNFFNLGIKQQTKPGTGTGKHNVKLESDYSKHLTLCHLLVTEKKIAVL